MICAPDTCHLLVRQEDAKTAVELKITAGSKKQPAAKKPDGEKPKKKTMKEKRADELAAKHATLMVLEKRLGVLPNFSKEVPKKTKMVTLRVWLEKRQAIFRQDFRDYCARYAIRWRVLSPVRRLSGA